MDYIYLNILLSLSLSFFQGPILSHFFLYISIELVLLDEGPYDPTLLLKHLRMEEKKCGSLLWAERSMQNSEAACCGNWVLESVPSNSTCRLSLLATCGGSLNYGCVNNYVGYRNRNRNRFSYRRNRMESSSSYCAVVVVVVVVLSLRPVVMAMINGD